MRKEKFDITGMACSACSAHVQKAVENLEGTSEVQVNLLTASMTVAFDENRLTPEAIIAAVEKDGYGASLKPDVKITGSKNRPAEKAEEEKEKMKKRLIISLCFMLPLFYISMGPMMSLPIPPFLCGVQNALTLSLLLLGLAVPVLIVNRHFFINGISALFRLVPNMDSLVAVGSGASVIYGLFAIYKIAAGFQNSDFTTVSIFSKELYFDSAAMILTLVTLGKFLELRAKKKTANAVTALINLAPKTAFVIRNGKETEISVDEIVKGDLILVKPGSIIPADGVIISGSSSVNEASITGESLPVEKTAGSTVISSSINISGTFTFKAERVGEDTMFAQIISLVETASATKAPVAKLADKISRYFVPAVMLISVISFAAWLLCGAGIESAFSAAVSVLVISCPCALGLAAPTAIMVGIGKGAQLGILIKSAEALETANKIDTVIFDKTGTITEGHPSLTKVIPTADVPEDEILKLIYSLELLSEHPLSKAIIDAAENKNVSAFKIEDFKAEHGLGIYGKIADEKQERYSGLTVFAGNKKLMEKYGIQLNDNSLQKEADIEYSKGAAVLFAAIGSAAEGKKLIGLIAVEDKVKKQSTEAVSELKAMGIHTVMLTGDSRKTAEAIQTITGIDTFKAELLPHEKSKEIESLKQAGKRTAMIGDGINDAPALVTADTGIAIGTGTDVAIESADIILVNNDLRTVPNALKLSKAVMTNIKENLFWALFYNSLCIPLAAGAFYPVFGWKLSPMIGAAAMSLSSVSVVTNALRLNRFKP